MALTIRTNANILTKNFNLKKLVNDCISSTILNKLQLRSTGMIKWVQYFTTFKLCDHTGEKTLSSVYMKMKFHQQFVNLTADEIEITGASINEFILYLEEKGAKEVANAQELLQKL
jgi:hypothetical protein